MNDFNDNCNSNNQPTNNIEEKNNIKQENKQKKKKKKNSCSFENCNARVVFMIGDCKWCNLKYCQEHRIPEAHYCSGLDKCKQNSFDINASSVNSMKCVSSKIVKIN